MAWRVLVVDDERLIRWALRERLTAEGCEVVEAADGREAERAVESVNFDCAILDLRLPDTDGVSLLRKIHRCRRNYDRLETVPNSAACRYIY